MQNQISAKQKCMYNENLQIWKKYLGVWEPAFKMALVIFTFDIHDLV